MTPELQSLESALLARAKTAHQTAETLRRQYAQKATYHLVEAHRFSAAGRQITAHNESLKARRWVERIDLIDLMLMEHAISRAQASKAGDPILRLAALGKLSPAELKTAAEIGNLARFANQWHGPKTTYFPTVVHVDEEPSGISGTEWLSLLSVTVYEPWRKDLDDTDLELVMGLVVQGEAIEALRKRYGMRWETALERIKEALKGYRKLRSGVYSQASERATA